MLNLTQLDPTLGLVLSLIVKDLKEKNLWKFPFFNFEQVFYLLITR